MRKVQYDDVIFNRKRHKYVLHVKGRGDYWCSKIQSCSLFQEQVIKVMQVPPPPQTQDRLSKHLLELTIQMVLLTIYLITIISGFVGNSGEKYSTFSLV